MHLWLSSVKKSWFTFELELHALVLQTQTLPKQNWLQYLGFEVMFLICKCDCLEGAHEEKYCLTGEPITLDCGFQVPSGARLQDIDVMWQFEGRFSKAWPKKSKLFEFKAGNTTQSSAGYVVRLDALLQGSASLYLANPTVADEGDFSCLVLVKPEIYSSSSVTLYVSGNQSLALWQHCVQNILNCFWVMHHRQLFHVNTFPRQSNCLQFYLVQNLCLQ